MKDKKHLAEQLKDFVDLFQIQFKHEPGYSGIVWLNNILIKGKIFPYVNKLRNTVFGGS